MRPGSKPSENKADPGSQKAGFPEASKGPKGEGRREVGSSASSHRDPPHVTPNDRAAPVQSSSDAPGDVPVLPANAGGRDNLTSDEQKQPIDDESMYDRRPSQDKDRPPAKDA